MYGYFNLLWNLLAVHGFTPCIKVSRMTQHRWKASDSVPEAPFLALHFQAIYLLSDYIGQDDFDNYADLLLPPDMQRKLLQLSTRHIPVSGL